MKKTGSHSAFQDTKMHSYLNLKRLKAKRFQKHHESWCKYMIDT